MRHNDPAMAKWWHREGERVVCDLCPRRCALKDGQRGFCFVRQNQGGKLVLTTYGKSTGFCIDPIEKKPLNHFFPGSSVLSFGTAGCNLGCRFCQNWNISKARRTDVLCDEALPEAIVEATIAHECRSVAFTYNDPVVFAEYAIDTARACRDRGVKTVAVTAGYIEPAARSEFFKWIDAANVDLKAFSERFYAERTLGHLQPVLDTLQWLRKETDVWLEVTTLLIPEQNDSTDELQQLCDWVLTNLGEQTPVHFTAFHPDFKMRSVPATSSTILTAARELALRAGLKHVYTGNVHDSSGQSTYCAACGAVLIERDWYKIGSYNVTPDGRCKHCQAAVAGRFEVALPSRNVFGYVRTAPVKAGSR